MAEAVAAVVSRMQSRLDGLSPEQGYLREFLGTYLRTTLAVGKAVDAAHFEDPAWVEQWDVVSAGLYLAAPATHLAGVRRRARGGWRSRRRPSCPRCATSCWAS